MNNNGNLDIGEKISNTVQNVLKTKDFNRLNRDIQKITKDALDEARIAISKKSKPYTNSKNRNSNSRTYDNSYKYNPNTVGQTLPPVITRIEGKLQVNNKQKRALDQTKHTVPMGQVSSVLLSIFGVMGIAGFGTLVLVLMLLGSIMGNLFYTIAILLSPLFFLSIGLTIKGNNDRKRLKRFEKYVTCLQERNYCLIEELSAETGLSNEYIEKDLRKMISKGMFPEGHFDKKMNAFMLTNQRYRQYLEVQTLEKIAEEKALQIEMKSEGYEALNAEDKKILDDGRRLVLEIREANIAIPGEEITRKLDRLEVVTGKIFNHVETHPEMMNEIRKFTDYFLPTTLKLLDAYKKLDDQSVQGQNISTAKKEIEKTMDTINVAFENLLDQLFQDMAMDISTDISVLETMLAQEGLTKDDMRASNKTREDK